MDIVTRIIQSLVFIGVGLAFFKYRREIDNWFGGIDFAEKIFGAGGTLLFLVILGTVSILIGVLILAGGPSIISNAFLALFGKGDLASTTG